MADKCAGCINKYKYFERPSICPECRRGFCQTCLPYHGKKVKKTQIQIATEQCVYCSKQRSINKSEEEDILSNFQERFYKHARTEPPIQSRLRLDLVMGDSGNSSPQSDPKVVKLSEEDKMLEDRLRKLKESDKKTSPSYSEEELKDKLEHLRGNINNKDCSGVRGKRNDYGSRGGGGNNGGGKLQTEESDELMKKATDEMRLDNRLRDGNDVTEDLRRRLQALKGGESSSISVGDQEQASLSKLDIKTFLDDIDEPFMLEDSPEKLLNDLLAFQSKESKNALAEVDSTDVQLMLEKAQELAKQEGSSSLVESGCGSDDPLPQIIYPLLPDGDEKKKNANSIDAEEIAKAIQKGLEEVQMEHEEKSKDMDYIKQTSEKLARIREEREKIISDDEVVRSKPKPKSNSHLDFSWGHFSTDSTPSFSKDQSGVVGRVLPNPAREEFNDEVQDLIVRMLEEAELDKRLEASGLKYQTEDTPTHNKMEDKDGSASGGAVAVTSFPPAQMAVPRIVYGTDDLPWCCICNDDATIHCYDCDDDLYCQRCFSDGHKQFGLFDHQYEMFESPQK